jgi:hypothetical protein
MRLTARGFGTRPAHPRVTHAGDRRAERTAAPSIPDVIFATVVIVLPLLGHRSLLGADGDLARHLRLGEWMVKHRTLLREDNFSFTRSGDPFLPFEWGSEVVFALAHRLGGLPAVAVFAAIVIAVSYALLAVLLRTRSVDPALTMVTALLAAITGTLHWLARPHLFTLVGVALLLFLLERPTSTARRRVWLFAPLFVLWANLHGGFLFGLILIAVYLLGSLVERSLGIRSRRWSARATYYAQALGIAVAACLLNPFGTGLIAHVVGFVGGDPFIQQHTHEFASPSFFDPEARVFLGVLLLVMGGLSLSGRRPDLPRLLAILVCVAFALMHQRNIALFGIVALPLTALHLDRWWRSHRSALLLRIRAVFSEADRGSVLGLWGIPAAASMMLLAWNGGTAGGTTLIPSHFSADRFPVEAVARARGDGVQGRIFNSFAWGGYLLYAWPEQKVFIDGGTDFYGAELMRAHMSVEALRPGWREALDRWAISLVLVPPGATLAHELARESAWGIWHCDSTAVLLRRRAEAPGEAWAPPEECLRTAAASPLRTLVF